MFSQCTRVTDIRLSFVPLPLSTSIPPRFNARNACVSAIFHICNAASLLVEGRTGELSSDDDFYLLDTGMVVLQTTNSIYNKTLYDLLTSASLTSWQRVRHASPPASIQGLSTSVLCEPVGLLFSYYSMGAQFPPFQAFTDGQKHHSGLCFIRCIPLFAFRVLLLC